MLTDEIQRKLIEEQTAAVAKQAEVDKAAAAKKQAEDDKAAAAAAAAAAKMPAEVEKAATKKPQGTKRKAADANKESAVAVNDAAIEGQWVPFVLDDISIDLKVPKTAQLRQELIWMPGMQTGRCFVCLGRMSDTDPMECDDEKKCKFYCHPECSKKGMVVFDKDGQEKFRCVYCQYCVGCGHKFSGPSDPYFNDCSTCGAQKCKKCVPSKRGECKTCLGEK